MSADRTGYTICSSVQLRRTAHDAAKPGVRESISFVQSRRIVLPTRCGPGSFDPAGAETNDCILPGQPHLLRYFCEIDSSKSAAGSLHQLATSAAPKLLSSIPDGISATEFSGAFIEILQSLMLAQAQEGVWQRAVIGVYPVWTQRVRLTDCRQLQERGHCQTGNKGRSSQQPQTRLVFIPM